MVMPDWITKYWVEWLFGIVAAALTVIVKRISGRLKKEQAENKALRNGMKSLLKAQILASCERAMTDGWCGPQLRDAINDMYASYTALEGNGTVPGAVRQTMELPMINPAKKGEIKHD